MASDGTGAPLAAALNIKEAAERLRDSLSSDDQKQIENTIKVQDVIDSLLKIQKELQQRRENRNLRKLYPFLQGLERYSGVIDTLSNGLSPYLPWIWAPIKLMLQITSNYLDSFDKLIDAYGRIAETLPRLNNLGDAFKDNPTLLTKLSLYYVDILEFHRRAYKFVRRRSWRFFFMTTWANFDIRFNSMLAAMTRHSDAIDQEATTIDIIESKLWREKLASQVAIREKDRSDRQRQSVIAWLTLDHIPQDDNRERVLRDCLPGSCDWVSKHPQVISWMKNDSKMPVLWLHGKPGADTNPDLITMAFTGFVEKHREPSLKVLRAMLVGSEEKQGLLYGIPACRILIDGLDECDPKEQKFIVDDLLQLVRDVPEISRVLQKKQRNAGIISLSSEKDSVNQTIQEFVESRLRELVDEKESLQIGEKFAEEIVRIIIDKADGMFLWARLVLDSLSDVDSVKELHDAITVMPRELPELYSRILETICPASSDGKMHKVMRILAWLVFAKRPLKHHEVLHGVGITPETPVLDKWNALDKSAIDKCKPLVEELPDGSIALIHFTAQEFLQRDLSTRRVNSAAWEELIAFACVTVIKDSLCLLDPELPRLNHLLHVLSGAHALLPYAIHFWLDHVLEYANVENLLPESELGQALSSFKLLHDGLYSKLKPSAISQDSMSSAVISTDIRLEALSHLTVYSLCTSIVGFRRDCASRSSSNGKGKCGFTMLYSYTFGLYGDIYRRYRIFKRKLANSCLLQSLKSLP
ncbi:NACHT domain-containing protein [Trichoderma gamsii]|uniref:NACHT domain-containing protein n=1 Tax=Trichoderma gamsii TaxID=398673 RepID=A0A2P4ZRP8_9HYPO|nr:NACHT domain-containing protein [Trichoderma gamsii]PON26980.1 NACHT domain-containing protein [Trichoderma gamsii]